MNGPDLLCAAAGVALLLLALRALWAEHHKPGQ